MQNNGKLYTTIMEKLQFEPRLDSSAITIAIKGNADIVALGGTVKTYAEKFIAENAIKNIPGIKAVVDELKVDSSTKYKRSDVDIAKAAKNMLQWNVLVPEKNIQVVVDDGYLTLSGEVEWQHQKYAAWKAVSNLWGVKSVINNIVVNPIQIIDPSTVKEKICKEFERNARIDASKVSVEVKGSEITLRGSVRNLEEDDEAIIAAWSIPGVSRVIDELIVDY